MGLAAHWSKANIREARLVEGKFALFWMLANGKRADLYPKANSPTDSQWARAFKGEFQEIYIDRGRGLHAERIQSDLRVILKFMQWSDQCHLDCLKYN